MFQFLFCIHSSC